jgi:hypothetical protein
MNGSVDEKRLGAERGQGRFSKTIYPVPGMWIRVRINLFQTAFGENGITQVFFLEVVSHACNPYPKTLTHALCGSATEAQRRDPPPRAKGELD